MRLKEQIALVTGGSRSIGREIALGFAREGAHVAVNYVRDSDAAQRTVGEIEALGCRAAAVKADTAKSAEVAAMVKEVWQTLGPVDILVNNAGVQKRIFFFGSGGDGLGLDPRCQFEGMLPRRAGSGGPHESARRR